MALASSIVGVFGNSSPSKPESLNFPVPLEISIAKVLLSIKNSKESIENPLKALNDYFGSYRDPSWDDFEIMKG
jgi:hypothetical protein